MTQAKQTTESTTSQDKVQVFIDTLIDNQKVIAGVLTNARDRGVRMSDSVAKGVADSQATALDLAKKVASNPSDYRANMTAMLESLTQSQTQAFDAFKTVVAGQGDITAEMSNTAKSLFEGTRNSSKAAFDLARAWGVENPMTDMMKKTFDTARETAEKVTKFGS
ncbi:MAG: hypothetical protein DRQ54_08765 [Gammaproteobacteria bacterium]|nr:MAG: hypothetical protein DRQ54_08765 [Gammaproteobacteria bacterium]RLA10657.1 MAG: hypothetical protein DRQ52_11005 [Gammaproteobacteria bacterium]